MDISICICTFRRPALLDRLLPMLAAQGQGRTCEILVADNDPAHSAEPVLRKHAHTLGVPLRWAHVPQPNIAMARNAVVGMATGTLLAFIDDDEIPSAQWLQALIDTHAATRADVVFAPVVATYRPETPGWMIEGKYFERQRFKTGDTVPVNEARTGNVLLARELLSALPGPFDLSFGNTGGEDTRLFRTLAGGGARFIWCDEAEVFEEVPADRATLKWLMQRSYRVGQTYLRSEWQAAQGAGGALGVVALLVRALVQLLVAGALGLLLLPFSRARAVRWARKAMAQLGKLSVLVGHRFNEYGKQSG